MIKVTKNKDQYSFDLKVDQSAYAVWEKLRDVPSWLATLHGQGTANMTKGPNGDVGSEYEQEVQRIVNQEIQRIVMFYKLTEVNLSERKMKFEMHVDVDPTKVITELSVHEENGTVIKVTQTLPKPPKVVIPGPLSCCVSGQMQRMQQQMIDMGVKNKLGEFGQRLKMIVEA